MLIFDIQEAWDVAKKLSCKYVGGGVSETRSEKMVIFKPLSVGMLNVEHQPFNNGVKDSLDCWMDILKGTYPNVRSAEILLNI